ncbi:hypothetical protein C8A00DRAFT_30092 [Chaetomidium leptoderma]|uniref:Uncharacterized protein n=1 Tax=Chaetomidium leptoderma TaxID=669021 RepID=A0AAN6VT89_9PEZI|nr:hypothetical protein C8A00DRAFT_30092 [Chaetomidium leptoderma]
MAIYTRAYSPRSAGELTSGRGPTRPRLTYRQLLAEFRNHQNLRNRQPTALVSVSDRIVDTIARALFHRDYYAESPADIWVVFIQVPATMNQPSARFHRAQTLAAECRDLDLDPNLFLYETVFEWAIPDEYVLHRVSLQTLMDRRHGSLMDLVLRIQAPQAQQLKDIIAKKLLLAGPSHGAREIGDELAKFAGIFGEGAPLTWIASRLFGDCVRWNITDDDMIEFCCELAQEVSTILNDDWLAELEFWAEYENLKERRDALEDDMAWERIRFGETWADVEDPDEIACDEAWRVLLAEQEEDSADFEEEAAVKLGL